MNNSLRSACRRSLDPCLNCESLPRYALACARSWWYSIEYSSTHFTFISRSLPNQSPVNHFHHILPPLPYCSRVHFTSMTNNTNNTQPDSMPMNTRFPRTNAIPQNQHRNLNMPPPFLDKLRSSLPARSFTEQHLRILRCGKDTDSAFFDYGASHFLSALKIH